MSLPASLWTGLPSVCSLLMSSSEPATRLPDRVCPAPHRGCLPHLQHTGCPHFPAPRASPFVSKVVPPFSSFFMAWPKRLFIWAFRNVLLYFPLHTPSQVHSFLPRLSSQNPPLLLLNLLCHLVITCVCVCSPDSTARNFPWAWTVFLVPVVLLSPLLVEERCGPEQTTGVRGGVREVQGRWGFTG